MATSTTRLVVLVMVFSTAPLAAADEGQPAASVGVSGAAAAAPDEDDDGVAVGAEAAVNSQYAARGFALTRAPVVQPASWATYRDFTAGGLAIIGLDPDDGSALREFDLTLAWSKSWGPLTVEPGVGAFYIPEGSTAEASVSATLQGDLVDVHTQQAVDLWGAPGALYAELGVGLGGELSERVSLHGEVDCGAGTARFHSYNAGVGVAGVTVVRAVADATVQLTEAIYVSGRFEVNTLVSKPVRRAVDEPTLIDGGVAAGFEL